MPVIDGRYVRRCECLEKALADATVALVEERELSERLSTELAQREEECERLKVELGKRAGL